MRRQLAWDIWNGILRLTEGGGSRRDERHRQRRDRHTRPRAVILALGMGVTKISASPGQEAARRLAAIAPPGYMCCRPVIGRWTSG